MAKHNQNKPNKKKNSDIGIYVLAILVAPIIADINVTATLFLIFFIIKPSLRYVVILP